MHFRRYLGPSHTNYSTSHHTIWRFKTSSSSSSSSPKNKRKNFNWEEGWRKEGRMEHFLWSCCSPNHHLIWRSLLSLPKKLIILIQSQRREGKGDRRSRCFPVRSKLHWNEMLHSAFFFYPPDPTNAIPITECTSFFFLLYIFCFCSSPQIHAILIFSIKRISSPQVAWVWVAVTTRRWPEQQIKLSSGGMYNGRNPAKWEMTFSLSLPLYSSLHLHPTSSLLSFSFCWDNI